jgi:hypothetical protein
MAQNARAEKTRSRRPAYRKVLGNCLILKCSYRKQINLLEYNALRTAHLGQIRFHA